MYPESLLIHTATLTHVLEETQSDTTGELVPTTTTTVVKCRFSNPTETFRGSPVMIVSTPRVVFPAGTLVAEGDTLESTEDGFVGTFRIGAVKKTYEAAVKTISHITCEIAAAGATGGA